MFTITQEESNKIQIFKQPVFSHLLIEFTYQCYSVIGLFENLSENCPYYLIDIVEVGASGTADPVNGEIKISPQSTWKAKVYGQDSSTNLLVHNATLIGTYKVKVKGSGCTIYAPGSAPDCLDATALIKKDSVLLQTVNIPSGTSEDINLIVTVV